MYSKELTVENVAYLKLLSVSGILSLVLNHQNERKRDEVFLVEEEKDSFTLFFFASSSLAGALPAILPTPPRRSLCK